MVIIEKIIYNRLIAITFILISCFFSCKSFAQLNLKIGYNLDYSAYSAHNQIVSDYNSNRPDLADEMKALRFASGFQAGFRLRGENIGTDFTWERSTASRSGIVTNPQGVSADQNFAYALNRFSLGLETYTGNIGIGANLYWEQFNIKQTIENEVDDGSLLRDNRFGNRIYLILLAPGSGRLSVSLQPYISIPFSAYNLAPLSSALGVERAAQSTRNIHFGFSVVLYNGPQAY